MQEYSRQLQSQSQACFVHRFYCARAAALTLLKCAGK